MNEFTFFNAGKQQFHIADNNLQIWGSMSTSIDMLDEKDVEAMCLALEHKGNERFKGSNYTFDMEYESEKCNANLNIWQGGIYLSLTAKPRVFRKMAVWLRAESAKMDRKFLRDFIDKCKEDTSSIDSNIQPV